MGGRRRGLAGPFRQLSGLLAVAKPSGPTSMDVLRVVQQAVPGARVGHGGTLDPLAAGVLVLALGSACKQLHGFLAGEKEYHAVGRFGSATDTLDSTGSVVARSETPVSQQQVLQVLPQFRGKIMQRPPSYSAVRVSGRRAYDLARKGKRVELAPRPVHVHRLDVLGWVYPEFRLLIRCGGGTYVRSLIDDIAVACGSRAHMTELLRVQQGPFSLADCITLDRLMTSDGVLAALRSL